MNHYSSSHKYHQQLNYYSQLKYNLNIHTNNSMIYNKKSPINSIINLTNTQVFNNKINGKFTYTQNIQNSIQQKHQKFLPNRKVINLKQEFIARHNLQKLEQTLNYVRSNAQSKRNAKVRKSNSMKKLNEQSKMNKSSFEHKNRLIAQNEINLRKKKQSQVKYAFVSTFNKLSESDIQKQITKLLKLYQQLELLKFKQQRIVGLVLKYCQQKPDIRYLLLYCQQKEIAYTKKKYYLITQLDQIFKRFKEIVIVKHQNIGYLINQFLEFIKNVELWIIQHNNRILLQLQNSIVCKKSQIFQQSQNFKVLPLNFYQNKKIRSKKIGYTYQIIRDWISRYGEFEHICKNNIDMHTQLNKIEKSIFGRACQQQRNIYYQKQKPIQKLNGSEIQKQK